MDVRGQAAELLKEIQHPDLVKKEQFTQQAIKILTTGKPLDLFQKAYDLNHNGDLEIMRAVVYGACLQSSRTTHGLQIFISGGKGTGKTNALKAGLNLIPPGEIVQGSFSDKAFFAQLGNMVKPVVFLDDVMLNDTQVSTMKRAMSNFQTVTEHHTLTVKERLS
jgi:hypothetical protein